MRFSAPCSAPAPRARAPGIGLTAAALLCALTTVQPSSAQPAGAPAQEPQAAAGVDAAMEAGRQALAAKRFIAAHERFSRAVKLAPNRAEAHVGLGEASFWLGDPRGALAHFQRAAALAPTLAQAHNGIGYACLYLALQTVQQPRTHGELLARADAAFKRTLAIDPAHAAALEGLRMIEQARIGVGHPLFLLEALVLALLVALTVAVVRHLRARGLPARPREFLWPIAMFAASRLVLLAAFAAAPTVVPEADRHPLPVLHDFNRFVLDSVAARWDSNLYADVAIHGYRLPPEGSKRAWGTVGQFPLLPVLYRWTAIAVDDAQLAALLLTHAALLLACLFLFALYRGELGARLAAGVVCVMLVHPASLHGSVLYGESLALLGMAGAALYLRRGAPLTAGAWGVFAGLARINALAIVPWLLLDGWRDPGGRTLRSLLARVSPVIGLGLFMLYLQIEFGDALAYFHELRGRRFADHPPLVGVVESVGLFAHLFGLDPGRLRGGPLPVLLWGFLCLLIYLGALAALVRARAFGPALFVASGIVLALGSSLAAWPRYLWLLFPAAVPIARAADRPVLRWALPLLSLAGLAAAAMAYARWYYLP